MRGKDRALAPIVLLLIASLLMAPSLQAEPQAGPGPGLGPGPGPEPGPESSTLTLPETALGQDRRIVHALNRLAYGPRPGDLSRIRRMGLEAYIEQQLHPESIGDEKLARRLEPLTTLSMTTAERLTTFPPRQLLRAVARQVKNEITEEQRVRLLPEIQPDEPRDNRADKKIARTSDPRKLAVRKEALKVTPGPRVMSDELAQAKLIRAIYSERQLEEVMTEFWFNHFNVFVGKGAVRWLVTDYEQQAIRPHAMGKFRDLLGEVARHPAMLFYLDNWLSSSPEGGIDGLTMRMLAIDGIRQQGLPPGGLSTLLLRQRGMDTADLERRIARTDARRRSRSNARGRVAPASSDTLPGRSGLNENFARELLELHTLGVDGGYTQQDIVEVARCFTGWSLLPIHAGQTFVYIEALHDKGPKTVLGKRIEGGGRREGEAVLDLLARHPSTARFVSTKLARRFVSDEPPTLLIERLARRFSETDGDIRAVLRTLLTSPEFWSPDAYKAKVKSPFEFVASAARATAAEMDADPARAPVATSMSSEPMTESMSDAMAGSMTGMTSGAVPRHIGANGLVRSIHGMGQPLYGCQPPTGYKDNAEAWVSAGALMYRMKMVMGLAAGRLRGVDTDVAAGLAGRDLDEGTLNALAWRMTGEYPSAQASNVILQQLALSDDDLRQLGLPARFTRSPQGPVRIAAGWILASADFQRR